MFAGGKVIACVKTSQGIVECIGNDSSQHQAISGTIGKRVAVNVDLEKVVLLRVDGT